MPPHTDRRRDSRTRLPHRPGALASERDMVRVLDLSLHGARIEHPMRLSPGTAYTLQLPVACGFLTRGGKVVWCSPLPHQGPLCFESGIQFESKR
jgi:PilZ domain-containing protein